MSDTKVRFEPRMLIDGKFVEGEAGTFSNVNPATEEVLGEVADASKADMHRAIDAATTRLRRNRLGCRSHLPQALPGAASAGTRVGAGAAA